MLKKMALVFAMISSLIFSNVAMAEDTSKVDNGGYKFTLTCMKDKVDELSMAGTYVSSEGVLTKDDKGNHVMLKFLRTDWMKDIKIQIDGKEVPHEAVPVGTTESLIKFDVPAGKPKIRVALHVVPMQADVAFRVVPNYDYEKISDDTTGDAAKNAMTANDPAAQSESAKAQAGPGPDGVVPADDKANDKSSEKPAQTSGGAESASETGSKSAKLPQTGSPIGVKAVLGLSAALIAAGIFIKRR